MFIYLFVGRSFFDFIFRYIAKMRENENKVNCCHLNKFYLRQITFICLLYSFCFEFPTQPSFHWRSWGWYTTRMDGWMDYTDLWRVLGQPHTNLNTSSKPTLITHLPTTMGVTWSVWFKWHEFHHNGTTGYWRVMTITRSHANDWIGEILGTFEGVLFFLSSGNLLTVPNKRTNKSIALGSDRGIIGYFLDSIRIFNHKSL